MISETFLLCFDIFVTLIVVPPLLIFLSPIILYKSGVKLLAKILHPEFLPLTENDPFTVWDVIKPQNGRHVYNVGVAVRANGIVSLGFIRQRIEREVLNPEKNGEKLYPRLYEEFVLFGGYAFRRKLHKMDINRQIREVSLGMQTLPDFKASWIEMSYGEGMAPWEIVVIPQNEIGETVCLLKIHHALADAYSLLYMFDTFLDNKLPSPPLQSKDSFWRKTRQFFAATRISTGYNRKVFSAASDLPWKLQSTETKAHVASTSLYFPDIKLIQRKTGAHYTSIMLSIFGGVLNRVLTDFQDQKTQKLKLNPATFVQLSFPWPNHPLSKLCNHWTSGGIRVPLGKLRPVERLKATEEDFNEFIGSEMDKIMKRFLFPIGTLMPVKLFGPIFEFTRSMTGLRTIFTSVIGFNENYYELDGIPVISVSPLTGILGLTPVISGLAFAYMDQVQVSFIATSELAKDQETMDRIIKNYFPEEVDRLIQQLDEIKN